MYLSNATQDDQTITCEYILTCAIIITTLRKCNNSIVIASASVINSMDQ